MQTADSNFTREVFPLSRDSLEQLAQLRCHHSGQPKQVRDVLHAHGLGPRDASLAIQLPDFLAMLCLKRACQSLLLFVGKHGVPPLIGKHNDDPVVWHSLPERSLASDLFGVGQADPKGEMAVAAFRTFSDAFRSLASAIKPLLRCSLATAENVYMSEDFLASAALWADSMGEKTSALPFAGVERSRGKQGYKFQSVFLLHCLWMAQQLSDDKSLRDVVTTSQWLSKAPAELRALLASSLQKSSRKGPPLSPLSESLSHYAFIS